MRRLVGLLLSLALVGGGCGHAPTTGQQPGGNPGGATSTGAPTSTGTAAGDVSFTLTFDFDTSAADPNVWTRGRFTTAGLLPAAFLAALTQAPTYTGSTWLSSGNQTFGDWKCTTPDQCLEPCTGSYGTMTWQDRPQIGLVSRAGSRLVLSALLSADPKPNDDQFLQSPGCPPTTGGGLDGFPPMEITIVGSGTGAPTLSVRYAPFNEAAPLAPGVVWSLAITPA